MGVLRKLLGLVLSLVGLFLIFVGVVGYFTWMQGGAGGVLALLIFWWLPLIFILTGLAVEYLAVKLLRK